jgi:hypothetical protein
VCVPHDWREHEKVVRPHLLEQPALRNGITRVEVAQALETGFEGRVAGFYREPGDVGTGVYPQEIAFACFLTMIVVPLLYAIFFKADEPSQTSARAN